MKIGWQAIIIVLAAVTLSCAQAKPVTYRCDGGANLVVVFDSKGEFAVLKMGEGEVRLPNVPSASGAKYSDGQTTFWGKGQGAFVEIDGRIVYRNCMTVTNRCGGAMHSGEVVLHRKYFYQNGGIPPAAITLVLVFLLVFPNIGLAETPRSLEECARIENATERLKCYDEVAGRKTAAEGMAITKETPPEDEELPTYLAKLWDLDRESRRGKFAVKFHRSNYILPFTYVENPNEKTVQEADSNEELKNAEIKFQLSFKVKLWQDILGKNMDLWFGYTQKSFWQFYNFEDSSPFRDTDYEPELLLNFRTNYDFLGLKGRFINVGFNHQSNGQSDPLSRSWNRFVANFGFERENFVLLLNTWLRVPEDSDDDDNPDIESYLGYGELWGYYFWKNQRFGAMVRNNFNFDDNHGALQLEWAFPIIDRVSGYIQYFHGYGESLLDYNHSVRRIGLGFMIKDWD